MEFLYFLEDLRFPLLDKLMLLITSLGEETAFLVAALIVFWCVDKYEGYYLLGVGLAGNLANQFLKITCRIPRPWVRDPEFTPLAGAVEEATGYSFPSGHSQTAVGYLGSIAVTRKNKLLRAVCIAFMILVPFSRMYVGVHTPADVLVGSAMALVMVFAFRPLLLKKHDRIKTFFGVMIMLTTVYLMFVETYDFPADVDSANYLSALKNGYTFLGCFCGVLVVYLLDEEIFHFSTEGAWYVQLIKIVGGLALVLLVKEGTRDILDGLLGDARFGRMARYFLMVVVAGVLWPMAFPLLRKLEKKPSGSEQEERN